MSVQTQIDRLESAKEAIATAIADKGVAVPDGTLLDGMASLIESIEAGSGGGANVATGSFTLSAAIKVADVDLVTISGLQFKPTYVIFYVYGKPLASSSGVNGSVVVFAGWRSLDYEGCVAITASHQAMSMADNSYCLITFNDDGFTINSNAKSSPNKPYYLAKPYAYVAIG